MVRLPNCWGFWRRVGCERSACGRGMRLYPGFCSGLLGLVLVESVFEGGGGTWEVEVECQQQVDVFEVQYSSLTKPCFGR